MKQRLLVAAIGVPLLIVVLTILPPIATAILICAMAGAAAYELLHTAASPCPLVYVLTLVTAAATVLAIYLAAWESAAAVLPYYLAWGFLYVMALFFLAVRRFGTDRAIPFSQITVCLTAAFLFPGLYSAIVLLRITGPFFVLMPFVAAFIGDSASMLGGMALGKRKLIPTVSPKKTWAGFYFGILGSALGMVLLALVGKWIWSISVSLLLMALIGAAANLFGQLGDLSMSLIKREAGIKDYSHIFLTHGGVLDRFDSIMFLAPLIYGAWMLLEGVL